MKTFKECLAEIIDFCFIALIFAIAFIYYPFILNSNKVGKELFLVTAVSLWSIVKCAGLFKNKIIKIYSVDVVIFVFFLYVIVHYSLLSFFSFGYNFFWVFTFCIVLFYLFRYSLERQRKLDSIFNFTIKLIWLYSFVESIIALLQKINFLDAHNEYFKVVGTFVNPNFLGVYMVIGIIITLYTLLFSLLKKNIIKLFFLVSMFSMLSVLYLTASRASCFSLAAGFLFLLFTSTKSIAFFKDNKKKGFILLVVLFFATFSLLYFLYQLNKDSVDGRTLIRDIAISEIKESTIFGNGIFNFTSIYNTSKAKYFNEAQRSWEEIKVANYVSTSFNDYLQIVFEIGIVGLILLGLVLFTIIRKIEFNNKTRLGLSLVIVFGILGLFTSVLYNPTAMVFLVWALSLLFVYGDNRQETISITNVFFIKSISLSLNIISLLTIVFFYLKTKALIDFKSIIEVGNQKFYYKISDNRMSLIEDDPFVEFKIGFEKFHEGEVNKGIRMMENSINKAPIPDANLTLSNIYLSQKKILKAEGLLLLNLGIEPFRFEPRENLLKFYMETKQSEKLLKTAKDIVDLPIKIESKKARLYKEKARKIILEYN